VNEEIKSKILSILSEHRTMTIATLRPDGWPQATTVVCANDDLTFYFVCGPESQKAANLARDDRVSVTIDHETSEVTEITGLSMAAHAQAVVNAAEASKALQMLRLKYPLLPVPMPEDVTIFRVIPTIISVIDYSKGFGHTDVVSV
jgi:nitroimidazol reductase NimA-like FMN-containing flavoprotein (pyridoxamine 5'-phosphate oxidase superfamily)